MKCRMYFNKFIVVLSILFALKITACFASISGFVRDTNGETVPGAFVCFTEENEPYNKYTSWTDSDGRYVISFTIGVDDYIQTSPHGFALYQNYPNPFNPTTVILFSLAETGFADLSIYNVLGQKVRTLLSGNLSEGDHSKAWDGRDDAGNNVGTGVFIYRLKCDDRVESKKMLLLDGGSSPLSIHGNTAVKSVISQPNFSTHSPSKMA